MSKNNNKQPAVTEELATVAPAGALAQEDDFLNEFTQFADKRTVDEVITERFRIVQALTKGKKENGLRDGQIFGNMTRKGLDKALIVPISETKTIVERTNDSKGTFVKEYVETSPGKFNDARVQKYVDAAGLKNIHKVETDNGNKLGLTYNCYVAFLDHETGLTATGFGVLQADKTNIRPYLLWRQNRVNFDGAVKFPTFSFRTWVDGAGEYTNPEGNTTQQYQFTPFKNSNWLDSQLLRPKGEVTPPEHIALLRKLADQHKLMASGAIKVAEFSDADDSEAAQEEAAF